MTLRCQDLNDLPSSPDTPIFQTIKRSMKWVDVVACGTYGERRIGYRLVGKPEGKRKILRPKHRWDNSKIDL